MFELVLRVGFSLLVIFGLMWGLARVVRRGGVGRGHGNLVVLNRQSLSRGSSIAVVQVADRALVLGVTDAQISLLGETELAAFEHEGLFHLPHKKHETTASLPEVLPHHGGKLDGSILSPRTWHSALDFLRDRTSRR
ncbi:flagellar biosynthetic protein FliO [Actinoplanes sp. TFC3]|uniref:flagellar biosynthetic protein FliO n=1 Tax=Actinoplanes sp. TFC3 TaxID=1710355 RepID=UPI00083562E0|nr:flagellar biosynthetic protein FliO [Actinoplanes sp. TFC3]